MSSETTEQKLAAAAKAAAKLAEKRAREQAAKEQEATPEAGMASLVQVLNEPYGWDRKVFISKLDDGTAVVNVLKAIPYIPHPEKMKDIKERYPETYATIKHECYLFVSLNYGSILTNRTVMLSQYLKSLRASGLPVYNKEQFLLHGYRVSIKDGELSFVAPEPAK